MKENVDKQRKYNDILRYFGSFDDFFEDIDDLEESIYASNHQGIDSGKKE